MGVAKHFNRLDTVFVVVAVAFLGGCGEAHKVKKLTSQEKNNLVTLAGQEIVVVAPADGSLEPGRVEVASETEETLPETAPPASVAAPSAPLAFAPAPANENSIVSEVLPPSPVVPEPVPPLESSFCAGLKPGECFTLVIQVPVEDLQSSPGLATFHITNSAEKWKGIHERTCAEGLQVGLPLFRRGQTAVFSRVKRSRCLIQPLRTEAESAPELEANEFGMKVRLVDFQIEGQATSTRPVFGNIAFSRGALNLKYHEAALWIPGDGKWSPVQGKHRPFDWNYDGVFGTVKARVKFNRNLEFQFDPNGTLALADKVFSRMLKEAHDEVEIANGDLSKVPEALKLTKELLVVKTAVAAIAAGSNPVVPALALTYLAVEGVKSLCDLGETLDADKYHCGFETEPQLLREVIAARLTLPSETKATYVDGLKHVPFALVKGVLENADGQFVSSRFSVVGD